MASPDDKECKRGLSRPNWVCLVAPGWVVPVDPKKPSFNCQLNGGSFTTIRYVGRGAGSLTSYEIGGVGSESMD